MVGTTRGLMVSVTAPISLRFADAWMPSVRRAFSRLARSYCADVMQQRATILRPMSMSVSALSSCSMAERAAQRR
jgi:hypothetical protein